MCAWRYLILKLRLDVRAKDTTDLGKNPHHLAYLDFELGSRLPPRRIANFPNGQEWQLELYLRDLPHHVFARQPRRLFGDIRDTAARDRTVEAFYRQYRQGDHKFPAECREPAYLERMGASYPIHPGSLRAAIRGLCRASTTSSARAGSCASWPTPYIGCGSKTTRSPHLAGLATSVRLERAAVARLDRRDHTRQTYTAGLELIVDHAGREESVDVRRCACGDRVSVGIAPQPDG